MQKFECISEINNKNCSNFLRQSLNPFESQTWSSLSLQSLTSILRYGDEAFAMDRLKQGRCEGIGRIDRREAGVAISIVASLMPTFYGNLTRETFAPLMIRVIFRDAKQKAQVIRILIRRCRIRENNPLGKIIFECWSTSKFTIRHVIFIASLINNYLNKTQI